MIATRTDLTVAAHIFLQALEASVDVAHLVHAPIHNPELTGPARALSVRAHNDAEHRGQRRTTEADIVWVKPQDIHANRTVFLPEPVAAGLAHSSNAVIHASVRPHQ